MNNPFTRYLVPTAALLTFASQTVAQNSETLEQSVSNSGSSFSNVLNNARYDFGRGLTFTSRDGEATMNVSGQLQAGYNWTETDAGAVDGTTNSDWSVPSSRLRVSGQAMDGLTYFMQFDPQGGENGNLVDGWVGWQVNDTIHARIGQQKMRSGLSADTSANDTDFETATRSIATSTFAGGRATGVLFTGDAMEGQFNWHAGVMNNGTGPNAIQANDGTDMSFTAGASFGSGGNSESWSEGDLARDGNMSWISGITLTQDNANADDLQTINAFAGLKMGNGVAAQVEFWTQDADAADTSDSGFYVQGSYTMAQSGSWQPGVVARFSSVDQESQGDEETTEALVGVNAYYSAHNLKTQLQVRQVSADLADADATSVDLLFTLVF
ncbi:OprO/OprP family phosphate-selective porin [bacterium]|nr:OprO/OprP family phosphate-selective porin [bacterium]